MKCGRERGGKDEFGGYIFISSWMYMYPATSCSPPRFLGDPNDILEKICEMAGDRSKIKTNHAWMGPKRGGDTRAYAVLYLPMFLSY